MLKAFFDETSDNTQDFLMAGWLARSDEWESFSHAWDKELKSSPSIECLGSSKGANIPFGPAWMNTLPVGAERCSGLKNLAGILGG